MRTICHEEHALIERDRLVDLPARKRLHVGSQATERGPVAARVLKQRLVLGQPDVAAATLKPVVEDAGGDLTPLPCPGAIAEHEAGAVRFAGLRQVEPYPLLGRAESSGEEAAPRAACIDNRLELRGGEQPLRYRALGQVRDVPRHGRGNRSHCRRFHEGGGVLARARERDSARSVGQVDASLLEQRRRHRERLIGDRRYLVADR